MVAPKGSGRSVRENFLEGSGINASFAIHQDATGRASERTIALGIAIGAGYLFPTTFKNEVYSDLTGERGAAAHIIGPAGIALHAGRLALVHGPLSSGFFDPDRGADLLSFVDTVGCLVPVEMYAVMSDLVATVKKPLCAHCHNDMGCATANTITAAQAEPTSSTPRLMASVNGPEMRRSKKSWSHSG